MLPSNKEVNTPVKTHESSGQKTRRLLSEYRVLLEGVELSGSLVTIILDLFETALLYGYRVSAKREEKVGHSLLSSMQHWIKLCKDVGSDRGIPEGESVDRCWMAVTKWKLAAFMAAMVANKLPKQPFKVADNPKLLLNGDIGRYLASKGKNGLMSERFSILSTINIGVKKGAPRPEKQDVKIQMAKSYKALTDPVEFPTELKIPEDTFGLLVEKGLPPVLDERMLRSSRFTVTRGEKKFKPYPKALYDLKSIDIDDVIREIYRTTTEVFGKIPLDVGDLQPYLPSTSANYISSRKNLGAIGAFLDEYADILKNYREWLGPKEDPVASLQDFKSPMEGESRGFDLPIYRPAKPIVTFDKDGSLNIEKSDEVETVGYGILPDLDQKNLKRTWNQLWGAMKEQAKREPNKASMVGLPEALKVRVITKSMPARSFVLQALQKRLHAKMRKHPIFQLTGTPVTEDIMNTVLGPLSPGESYISGDYEAATDNIYSQYSEMVGHAMSDCMGLEDDLRELFIESLTRFEIEDPEDKTQSKPQTRGQLMGSVTSFPVLCILNAAMSRFAYEISIGYAVALKNCPMLINGDDIAIRGPKCLYDTWSALTGFVGLKESVGKTYNSRDFVQINSTNFTVEAEKLKQIKFVNFGLLKGLKRSGLIGANTDTSSQRESPHARFTSLINDSPLSLRETLAYRFIELNRLSLEQNYGSMPWHIPCWLGGVGIYHPELLEAAQPSSLDLRIAAGIIYSKRVGDTVDDISKMIPSWKIRKLAEKRCPRPFTVKEKGIGTETYETYVGLKGISLLFDSSVRLTDLFDTNAESEGEHRFNSAIRRNRAVWNPRRWTKCLPPPLKKERLAKQCLFQSYLPQQDQLDPSWFLMDFKEISENLEDLKDYCERRENEKRFEFIQWSLDWLRENNEEMGWDVEE